jgi:UDP-N-acetylglucosamine 2-epimerase
VNQVGKKVLTVVGARPQFVKMGPVSRALKENFEEIIVHTGQHYDPNMSEIFFKTMGLPRPNYQLALGGGGHGNQTGRMLIELEQIVISERPDAVLVYGDTNSTLAGALVAAKLNLPIAHIEAGLRSFNRQMPEEINRVLTDHLSKWLFVPTELAANNLKREGINEGVLQVGDVMLDVVKEIQPHLVKGSGPLRQAFEVEKKNFVYLTLHRAENVDNPDRLIQILKCLETLSVPCIWPVHPRTRDRLHQLNWRPPTQMKLIAPIGHFESLGLALDAKAVVTDSGGLQKEAYFLRTPCFTMRTETEWTETVETGWNRLIDPAVFSFDEHDIGAVPAEAPPVYGDGTAALRIADLLGKDLK